MPLFREWSSDPFSLAAIWEIGEPEAFFRERTGLSPEIKSEKRRMEHLAGRFLLKHLQEDFPLLTIRPDEHDKPRLEGNQYYFSISHSFPYVAAVVSPYVECGIDIQVWHPHMERLQHKFLSAEEQSYFQNDPKMLTLAWSAKEAAYKWQGRRGVEFIDHLPIVDYDPERDMQDINIFLQLISQKLRVLTKGIVEQYFVCSYVSNQEIIHPHK
jgi:4'-phosphopantetheinyl transferase